MKNKMILTSLMAVLSVASATHAESRRGPDHGTPPGIEKDAWDAMSKEEKQDFHQKRKAKWEKMSDADKVKMIEQHRAKKMEKMDSKWQAMSDAEKVKYAEEKMKDPKKKRRSE